MKTKILGATYNACSGEGVLGDALRYDVDPLTKSFLRSQLGVALSCQNDASHRHLGFAQNRSQMKSRKTTSQGDRLWRSTVAQYCAAASLQVSKAWPNGSMPLDRLGSAATFQEKTHLRLASSQRAESSTQARPESCQSRQLAAWSRPS